MRSGWNPTRRNRNIGTRKQGHGRDNALNIPKAWPDDRVFSEILSNPVAITRTIQANAITFLVEPTQANFFYPCTVDDVAHILRFIPPEHLDGLELVIFRQPTRKQVLLNPVWGRFRYYAAPSSRYNGTAICIEAQTLLQPIRWPRSLTPDDQRELNRLRQDGHQVQTEKRHYRITSTAASMRNTTLFRTILHETGHYVDWLQNLLWPILDLEDESEIRRLEQMFKAKPSQTKEDFAHRYADELFNRLKQQDKLPFPQIFDYESMQHDRLNPNWFMTHHADNHSTRTK